MLVGQGYVLDSGQEQTRIGCELSTIPGFAVSTAFAHGSGHGAADPEPRRPGADRRPRTRWPSCSPTR